MCETYSHCIHHYALFSCQRSALAIAANCCHFVSGDDFHLITAAIPILSAKLQIQVNQNFCVLYKLIANCMQNFSMRSDILESTLLQLL